LEIHADITPGAMMNVFIKGDSDTKYELVKSFTSQSDKKLLLPVIISKNCYKIKITGRGYVKINAFKRTAIRGGRI
jgi:hypothetical protein